MFFKKPENYVKGIRIVRNKSKILIVDDSIANRRMLSAIFDQHTDYEILSVKSGRSLLKVVERYQPDIILLDIMMPEKEQLYTDSLTKLPNRMKPDRNHCRVCTLQGGI